MLEIFSKICIMALEGILVVLTMFAIIYLMPILRLNFKIIFNTCKEFDFICLEDEYQGKVQVRKTSILIVNYDDKELDITYRLVSNDYRNYINEHFEDRKEFEDRYKYICRNLKILENKDINEVC